MRQVLDDCTKENFLSRLKPLKPKLTGITRVGMAARLLSRRLTTTAAVNVRRVFACNAVRPWSFTARPDHIFPHGTLRVASCRV